MHDDDDDLVCGTCAGSGEGLIPDVTQCPTCGHTGRAPESSEDDWEADRDEWRHERDDDDDGYFEEHD